MNKNFIACKLFINIDFFFVEYFFYSLSFFSFSLSFYVKRVEKKNNMFLVLLLLFVISLIRWSIVVVLVIKSIELLNNEHIYFLNSPIQFQHRSYYTNYNDIPFLIFSFFSILRVGYEPRICMLCCCIISKSNKTHTPNWYSRIYSIT